jgi:hypothetical protein
MTTDERIARLTERHEALTQSVELLVQVSREQGDRIAALAEAANALLQIAQIHETRITQLEERG